MTFWMNYKFQPIIKAAPNQDLFTLSSFLYLLSVSNYNIFVRNISDQEI